MIYKYQKIVTEGANGTTIMHNNVEGVSTLGEIDGYIFITALSLTEQPTELSFIEVTLTEAEKKELLSQKHMQTSKLNARNKIRSLKDFEDDLTDQKKIIQFMARGFAGLWASLPQDIKNVNPYKDNFDIFSSLIVNNDFRLDLETDHVAKITKILNDETEFAQIVDEEYLGKLV